MPTLREQLTLYGASTLSPVELLSIALLSPRLTLSSDIQSVLTRLMTQGDWKWFTQAGVSELQQAGFSQLQAERAVAICELSRRLALLEQEPFPQIKTTGDAVRLLQPLMAHLPQEVFRVLVLNAQNQVVENIELYRGTVLGAEIRVAEILRPAIVRHCPALLIAHHHPSGEPEPSESDLETTRQLRQAAELFGIDLLDHLILGHKRALSLRSYLKW
jgi:DNA repair protein RadC